MPETTEAKKTYWSEAQEICQAVGIPGRDHASMLLYCQTLEADHGGDVKWDAGERIRCKHGKRSYGEFMAWDPKHGSRYWDGSAKGDHDDLDCVEDLENAGLLENKGSGFQPVVRLTQKGHETVAKLIALRGRYHNARR